MKVKIYSTVFLLLLAQIPTIAADYFWVGGTGLWSETDTHWATTSGGSTFHSIIPTSTDNVIFDENSFSTTGQVVTLDGFFANCLSMDWSAVTNSPEFRSDPGGTLYVFGSLSYSDNMTVDLNTDIEFQSALPGQTIYSGGHPLTETNISFNNSNGEWELLDSLNVGTDITIEQGSLNTNGHAVVASRFYASDGVSLNMENSTFLMDVNYQSGWFAQGTESNIITTNSTIYAYQVGLGTGYVFHDIFVTNRSLYGDSADIQHLTFLNIADINLSNSEVQNLTVIGNKTDFERGPNYFHTAKIASETVNFPTPPWYYDHTVAQEFDSLLFTLPGVAISIDTVIQKVNNYFHIAANCENYSEIKSSVPGSPVRIETPVDVTLEFIRITDVHISGGAVYTINSAVDNGGNDGWILNETIPNDLYWIGASSNDWNDGGNWSLTSGGTPYGCSPTIKDNVFFDANSFSQTDTVEITTPAFAKNVDWTGAGFTPLFKGSEEFNINGSLKMIADMTVSNYAAVNFISCATGNTIELNGVSPTRGDVKFDCPEGEWSLLDSLTTSGAIRLNNGSLIADGVKISADMFYTLDSTSLSLDNSEVELTYYDGWEIGDGVNLNAATTEFHMNSGQHYSIPKFQGGTAYTYGNIYLEAESDYTYTISCESCQIDSIIGVTGQGRLNISETDIDYVELVSASGSINSDNSFIKELVINTSEEVLFNTNSSSEKLTVESLYVQNPAVNFVLSDTLEITNTVSIPSNCNTFFSLRSLTQGVPAYLLAPDNLVLEYASIQDIIVGNGTNYQANNSIDNGGNTNWQFTSLIGQKLFWIGNEGDWDNGNNWSLTSGGAPLGCVPSPLDTVIFDDNSFSAVGQTVTVTAGINITTMDWSNVTNNPIFSTTGDLNFNGSLMYSEDMVVNTASSYLFNSCTSGNVIQTGNHEITDHYDFPISFNCTTGSWSLQDTLELDAWVYLNQGELITNGNTIISRYFEASDNTSLDIRNSDIFITYGWELEGSGINFQADSSYIRSTYSRFEGGNGYDYWDVEYLRGSYYTSPDFRGSNLSFNTLTLDDVIMRATNSVVDSLITIGEQTTLAGSGNHYNVADINTTKTLTITGSQEFDILNVNLGGVNVVFESDETQTVNKELNIAQEPSFPIYFSATTQGTQAHINFLGVKPPCSEFIFLRDNNIYGPSGVPFYAGLDSDDIDNNTGWVFETSADCNTLLCEFEGITIDLGEDIPLFCFDHKFEVSPLAIDVDYQWQALSGTPNPQDTLTEFTITASDTVVLTLSTDICTISDTIVATKGDCSVIPLEICNGDSALLAASIIGNAHTWNTGATSDTIYATTTGFYWVDNDDGAGTVVRDSFYVDIITLPALDLGKDTALCNGTSFSFTAPSGFDSFLWSFGSTSSSYVTDTASHVWLQASINACSIVDTIQITTSTIQLVGLGGDTTLCNSDSLNYVGVLSGMNYEWENGDAGFENIARTISNAGTYWLEISANGCSNRDSIVVSYISTGDFSLGNDTTLCDGNTLDLTAPSGFDSYLWQDGSALTSQTATTTGLYWVEATLGNCTSYDTIAVTSVNSVNFSLGADTTLCAGDTLLFAASLANHSFEWEDGSLTQDAVNTKIADSGLYWLEIGFLGCYSRDTIVVSTSNPAPIDLGNDTTLCDGNLITLSTPNVYDAYLWNDGSNSNSLSTNTSGTYWLQAISDGCSVIDTIQIATVATSPSVNLGNDTTLCNGETLSFLDNGIGQKYLWENGDQSLDNMSREISQSGTYWLEVSANGCITRDSVVVTALNTSNFDLGSDTTLCNGNSITLSVPTGYDTYSWSNGNTNESINTLASGIYWAKVTQGTCSLSDTIEIFTATLSFDGLGHAEDTTICPGSSITWNYNLAGITYAWENGSSGFETVNRNIDQEGQYWIDVSKDGCTVRDSLRINFETITTQLDLGNDTTLCDGNTLNLTAPAGFDSYLWQDGSTTLNHTVQATGDYKLNVSVGHCQLSDSLVVTILPQTFLDLGEDTTLCEGESLLLNSTTTGAIYTWENGDVSSNYTNREIRYAGTYILEMDLSGCITQDTITIESTYIEQLDLGEDISMATAGNVTLEANANYDSYLWSNGSTSTYLDIATPGLYSLQAMVDGCETMDTIEVFSSIIIPSAFTPNGDGKNDVWVIPGIERYPNARIHVYNRWGNLVFTSDDYQSDWSGDGLPVGTYYYTLEHDDFTEPISGVVTLLNK